MQTRASMWATHPTIWKWRVAPVSVRLRSWAVFQRRGACAPPGRNSCSIPLGNFLRSSINLQKQPEAMSSFLGSLLLGIFWSVNDLIGLHREEQKICKGVIDDCPVVTEIAVGINSLR